MHEHLFPILEALGLDEDQRALVGDVVELCRVESGSHHAPGELAEAMVVADRVRTRVEAVAALPTHRFAAGTDWAEERARSAPGWLATNTGVGRGHAAALVHRAHDLVRAEHVLAGARRGALSPDKVRLLLAARTPELAEAFDDQEEILARTVAGLTVSGAAIYLRAWALEAKERLGVNDPDRFRDRGDTNWFRLRSLLDGRHAPDGELDAEASALLQEALDARVRSWQLDGSLEGDGRSLTELYAAALLDLVGRGAGHATPNRPSALILLDHDTLVARSGADGPLMPFRSEVLGHGPVPPDTLRRMCCNANITRIVMRGTSEVLDVGKAQRLATPAIRAAVWARSRGLCEVCHLVKLTWCQVHHLVPWDPTAGDGPTSVENSALVCNRCHRLVHEGRHSLRRTDGGFELVRPDGAVVSPRLHHRPRGTDPPRGGAPPGRAA